MHQKPNKITLFFVVGCVRKRNKIFTVKPFLYKTLPIQLKNFIFFKSKMAYISFIFININ